MNLHRRLFLIVCLIAFASQSLAVAIPAACGDHEGSMTLSGLEVSGSMDHSQHHDMDLATTELATTDTVEMDSQVLDSQTKDCCELDCGNCIVHHNPSLLIGLSSHSAIGRLSELKYSLTSDALTPRHSSSLFSPPITR